MIINSRRTERNAKKSRKRDNQLLKEIRIFNEKQKIREEKSKADLKRAKELLKQAKIESDEIIRRCYDR